MLPSLKKIGEAERLNSAKTFYVKMSLQICKFKYLVTKKSEFLSIKGQVDFIAL